MDLRHYSKKDRDAIGLHAGLRFKRDELPPCSCGGPAMGTAHAPDCRRELAADDQMDLRKEEAIEYLEGIGAISAGEEEPQPALEIIRIEMGATVLCDFCGDDLTSSKQSGGLLFQSKAACPKCAPRIEASAKHHREERFIRGRCPACVPFADWVRGMR